MGISNLILEILDEKCEYIHLRFALETPLFKNNIGIWRFLTSSYKIYHLEKTDFSDFWNLWKKNVFRDYKLPRSFSGFIMVLQNLRNSILASTYLLTFAVPIPNEEKKLT